MTMVENIAAKFKSLAQISPDMSGKMIAILGWIVQKYDWVKPSIMELVVTSDDFVLARHDGDIGMNDILGSWADFERNVLGCIKCAALTEEEGEWVKRRIKGIRSYR